MNEIRTASFYDATTGETIVRELTAEEIAEHEALIADNPVMPSAE